MRSNVDLPQPEAPTSVTNSLSLIDRLMPCRAAGVPAGAPENTLPTWRI